jgi:hypothetical protein
MSSPTFDEQYEKVQDEIDGLKLNEDKMNDEEAVPPSPGLSVEEAEGEVLLPPPPSFASVLLSFLRSIGTQAATADFQSIPAPAVLMNGVSLLEYSQHYGDHPDLLKAMGRPGQQPHERLIAVLRWYLSTLWGSYASRTVGKGMERKPYNPILGEQFHGEWPTGALLTCEQVSHHPPVSAFHIADEEAGVYVNGNTAQSTAFKLTGYVKVRQRGRVFVYLREYNEEITITLPDLDLCSLMTGSPYLQIVGETLMLSSTGWAADIDFIGTGMFGGGPRDRFNGVIFDNESGQVHYDFWGNWKADSLICPHGQYDEKRPRGDILYSREQCTRVKPRIRPLREQSDCESRRVWQQVTAALQDGRYDEANKAKEAIENVQRALKRERQERGQQWTPKLFTFVDAYCLLPCTQEDSQGSDAASIHSIIETHRDPNDEADEEDAEGSTDSSSTEDAENVEYEGRWILTSFKDRFDPDDDESQES